jgi:hypothetical protein
MKNISKGWKTSLIGVVIIGAALTSVFFEKTWAEASLGLAIGVGLLFAPDTVLSKITSLINGSK